MKERIKVWHVARKRAININKDLAANPNYMRKMGLAHFEEAKAMPTAYVAPSGKTLIIDSQKEADEMFSNQTEQPSPTEKSASQALEQMTRDELNTLYRVKFDRAANKNWPDSIVINRLLEK